MDVSRVPMLGTKDGCINTEDVYLYLFSRYVFDKQNPDAKQLLDFDQKALLDVNGAALFVRR